MDNKLMISQLIKSIKMLSSEKKEQIEYLIELGTFPSTDELALEFDDAYKAFLGTMNEEENQFSYNDKFLETLVNIKSILDEMDTKDVSNFWDVSSLKTANWNKLRELSSKSLKEIHNLGHLL